MMNKSPMLHPSRSYKRSLGRFGMTGGLVATLDGSTTSTNKLQTRQTPSTNYTEHIIKKEHPAKCVYCPDSDETIEHFLFHCPLYDNIRSRLLPAQPNIHNTLYGSTTQLQRTATYNMSAMNRRDEIVRSLGDQERKKKDIIEPFEKKLFFIFFRPTDPFLPPRNP